MKFKSILILFLSFSVLISCKKEKTGGKCEYDSITKNVSATFVDGDINKSFTVSFQPVGVDSDEVYRITEKELEGILKDFELNDLLNKQNTFEMKIEEISKGSCVPFVIKSIALK